MHRKRRKTPDLFRPFASFPAFLFVCLLTLAPVISARVIGDAYGGRNLDFSVTPSTRAQTRDAIDRRFRDLLRGVEDKREAWSELVGTELDEGRFSAARGLLLAAPEILGGNDAVDLRTAAGKANLAGDAAIEAAAIRMLDDRVQVRYSEMAAQMRQSTSGGGTYGVAGLQTSVEPPDIDPVALNILGDTRDLALQAGQWLRNEEFDEFAFALSGLGLTVVDPSYRSGASVLRSAHRARRLNPQLEDYLSEKVFRTASMDELRQKLAIALQDATAVQNQREVVEAVFRETAKPAALVGLEGDLELVRDIARQTSPADALEFLQIARSSADLRRARLVALAGGDRALGLARVAPDQVLDAAQTEIVWTNRLRLMVVSLGAIAVVLTWIAFSTLLNSFWRQGETLESVVYARKVRRWQLLDNKP